MPHSDCSQMNIHDEPQLPGETLTGREPQHIQKRACCTPYAPGRVPRVGYRNGLAEQALAGCQIQVKIGDL